MVDVNKSREENQGEKEEKRERKNERFSLKQ